MTLTITRIGDSKGIQIPDAILDQCKICDLMEIEIIGNSIVLKPVTVKPRQGWDEAFQLMRNSGDDHLLIDVMLDMQSFAWEW